MARMKGRAISARPMLPKQDQQIAGECERIEQQNTGAFTSPLLDWLVFRGFPRGKASIEILDVAETEIVQDRSRPRATNAGVTIHQHRFGLLEFCRARGKVGR